MPGNLSCGAAVAGLLEQYGVDIVFGIPGVHTLELYKGLAGASMRHVLVRHEQGAGFMADGYARASGRPGVCLVITGPGVTNIATPMGQAYSDSVPMLVISSVNETQTLGRGLGQLHEIDDQQAVTAPLTGASYLANTPGEAAECIGRAFSAFGSRRPRPVHVSIPLDVLSAPAGEGWQRKPQENTEPPSPEPSLVDAARDALSRAERPMILAGGGAVGVPQQSLTQLAENLGAAVVTTTAGKGVVAESHPLSLGGSLSWRATQDMLASADVVLVLGSGFSQTDSWADGALDLGALAIHVDIEPAETGGRAGEKIAITSDAARFVEALGAVKSAHAPDRQHSQVAQVRKRNIEKRGSLAQKHVKVLEVLRAALPADGFVASDMTQIAYTALSAYPVDRPRCWFHPSGFGTLGYALPAAIGAKLACPDRAGVSLAGDFGFQFTLQELGTAVELGLNLPILLWNNGYLGQIRDDMIAQDIPEVGVQAQNPDFVALAGAFGCAAERPASLDQLGNSLRTALAENRPTLIEVRDDLPDLQG